MCSFGYEYGRRLTSVLSGNLAISLVIETVTDKSRDEGEDNEKFYAPLCDIES